MRLLKVRGNSLWPDFREGDYVLAAGVPFPAWQNQAGDVIVFRQPGLRHPHQARVPCAG
jgi:signal peptidase I